MMKVRLEMAAASLALLVLSAPAYAQDAAPADSAEPMAAPVDPEAEPNEDEMADDLNSRQQLKQTVILKRTVDGKVVETDERTVTYDRNAPSRATEAGQSAIQELKQKFDGEALTRKEAFEEAKLDFVIADVNRDDRMTAEEFAGLVESWRTNETRQSGTPTKRQEQYDAFLDEIDPQMASHRSDAYAKQKFAFMAGAAEAMTLQDYIREYLLDFDSLDTDKDMVLTGDELMRFRALNRGETLDE